MLPNFVSFTLDASCPTRTRLAGASALQALSAVIRRIILALGSEETVSLYDRYFPMGAAGGAEYGTLSFSPRVHRPVRTPS